MLTMLFVNSYISISTFVFQFFTT